MQSLSSRNLQSVLHSSQSKSAKRPMTGKSNSLLVNLKELFQKKVWEANEGTSMMES